MHRGQEWEGYAGTQRANNLFDVTPFPSQPMHDWCLPPTLQEIVTCLELASRIGFDRKVSCLTYFYLTRFPTAKLSFKLDLKLVQDILTLPLKLQR